MSYPRKNSLSQYRALLVTYLGPQRGQAVLLGALLVASIALQLVNPQIVRNFLDSVQAGGPEGALVRAGLAFIAIGLIQRAVSLGAVYLGENVGWAATNALRIDLTRHVLRLDMSFHKRHTPGELIERIDGDATALANFFSQFVVRILANALLVLGVLALLFREDWRLGSGMTFYAVLTITALVAFQNLTVRRWTAQRSASADLFGFLEERLNGAEDIRSSGAERHTLNQLNAFMHTYGRHSVHAFMTGIFSLAAVNAVFVLGYTLALALGVVLYLGGVVTIGTTYLVVFYVAMLQAPLDNVRSQMQDLGQARASLERITALLALRTQVTEPSHPLPLPPGSLAVELDAVSFVYHETACTELEFALMGSEEGAAVGATEVFSTEKATESNGLFALDTITVSLQPGRVLGLLGRTGSGKTTLARLLFRLYDPEQGAIRLGDVDSRAVALTDLRSRVGMITQDVQLFQASIRDNLVFFNPAVSNAQVEDALRALGLWEWVCGLPAGLDTVLGADGHGLSAGEAQLLAFARVFLRDPGLVILDEASSRLDPATEMLLERAIDRLLRGRTGIIIAHRLHTVRRADDILIMENGRVVEFGVRTQLAADPGSRFYSLLRTGLEEALA